MDIIYLSYKSQVLFHEHVSILILGGYFKEGLRVYCMNSKPIIMESFSLRLNNKEASNILGIISRNK